MRKFPPKKRSDIVESMQKAEYLHSQIAVPCTLVKQIYGVQKGFCGQFNDCRECIVASMKYIAELISPDLEVESKRIWSTSNNTYICKNCSYLLPEQVKYCPECGAKIVH